VNRQYWNFRFLDTCFFRDGFPYNAGEGGYSTIRTLFPPYMTTLQGAIRTSLAEEKGWRPGQINSWPAELGSPDDPGEIQFQGPYIWTTEGPLFPMPLHLLIKKQSEKLRSKDVKFTLNRLAPGKQIKCDLGEVRLPELEPMEEPILAGAGLSENLFITRSGLQAVLQGTLPKASDLRDGAELWFKEDRIGLERDDKTSTARGKMLYHCVHIRPARGLSLSVSVSGIPQEWPIARHRILNLGGEGRLAEVTVDNSLKESEFLPPPEISASTANGGLCFTVTLITPGWYNDLGRVIREGPPGIPGKCLTACLGKIVSVGGWDLFNQKPRPLVPLLPVGSTWFFVADTAEVKEDELIKLHGQCISAKTAFGFGQILIGKWKGEIR